MGFHVVKRENCPLIKKCGFYLAAVVLALLMGALLLLALGVDPIAYYTRMFTMGTIGNKIAYKVWINYLKEFVPLALTSVALSLAFKMRFWNIGGEGQFILGAIASAFVAFQFGPVLPDLLTLVLMCLAAMLVALTGAGIGFQVTIFVIVAAVCLTALRPLVRKYVNPKLTKTNVDAVVGTTGLVTVAIDNVSAVGQVKLGAMYWTARSTAGDAIPEGTLVRVDRIEGVKVFVTPMEVSANV